jgi:peptidoglycan hydrolase-like protein with peptidoglycan-binding domain
VSSNYQLLLIIDTQNVLLIFKSNIMKNTFKAAIFALALTVTVGASAEGYMFNTNLTVGSRGADVTALQNILAAGGYFTATPTGYFGSITKAAVQAYQRANAITPVSGYFGPLTRAVMNSTVTTTTPTTPTTTVCPVGYVCQPTTTTGTTGAGQEGFAEVRVAPTPTNNPNVQISTNVPVYGIIFTAKQADISVERINLQVSVDSNGGVGSASFENPSTLINTVTVWDGSTLLQTIPVNSSTFTKITSNGSSTYYLQIAGLNLNVAKDSSRTLTVSLNTNAIDTTRSVTVGIFGGAAGQGIRTVDTRGISNFSGLGDTRSHLFKKPGTSTLTAKDDATTLYSTNYRINRNGSGAEKVLTSTFALKSETGSSKITGVSVLVPTAASGTLPSTLYLYDGSTLLDARSVTASSTTADGYVIFDLNSYNINIDADTTRTFSIKADLPSTTASGTLVATQVYAVTYEKPNGSSEAFTTLSIPSTAVYHYFAPIVAQFGRVSSTATIIRNGSNSSASSLEARFALTLTAQGGNIRAASTTPVASISLINASTGAVVSTVNSLAINDESGLQVYPDGGVKGVTFLAGFATSSLVSGTAYKAVINSISYLVDGPGNSTTTLSSGFQALDTSTVTY